MGCMLDRMLHTGKMEIREFFDDSCSEKLGDPPAGGSPTLPRNGTSPVD